MSTIGWTTTCRSDSTSNTRLPTAHVSAQSPIHRALFGSIERFFAVLLEHYARGFPAPGSLPFRLSRFPWRMRTSTIRKTSLILCALVEFVQRLILRVTECPRRFGTLRSRRFRSC